ncbi:MAG: hypothetical protein JWQ35_88 [Bacteriovoracaceae bacterium]|nr:hypothetical protein [Bacteriovoracaceae bacterium]
MYLTYDKMAHQDGVGSQYQRIVGIFALAELLRVKYIHTPPIIPTIFQGYKENETEIMENFFGIQGESAPDWPTVEIKNPNLADLEPLIQKNVIVKIYTPYKIVEKDQCAALMAVMPALRARVNHPTSTYDSKIQNMAIHIRLGDVLKNNEVDRLIPVSIYKSLIENLKTKFSGNIHIFSQDTPALDEIRNLDLEFHLDRDLPYTLSHMMKADILFISKSSFSYLAGLYNPNRVFYIPFWHSPAAHWTSWAE